MQRKATLEEEDAEVMWLAAQREAYHDNNEDDDEDEELLRGVPCANDDVPAAGGAVVQRQQHQLRPMVVAEGAACATDDASVGPALQVTATTTTEAFRGICEYPPLSLVSFMIRGDNGVVRWLTASGLKAERPSRKRGRELEESEEAAGEEEEQASAVRDWHRRHGGGGLGYVDIPALLQHLYDAVATAARHVDEDSVTPPPTLPAQPQQQAPEEALWVIKYSPKRFRELLSDDNINLKLLQWLKSWDAYIFQDAAAAAKGDAPPARPEERLAVLVGPPGVGKTTLAHVLAAHCGYEAIEINASVDRTASKMESAIQLAVAPARVRRRAPPSSPSPSSSSAASSTVDSATRAEGVGVSLVDLLLRPKCLIIDEMDGIATNVATFLLKQDIHCPVFCLCNDFYVPSLQPLRRQCQHVYYLPPIRPQRLLSRLSEIAAREGLPVSQPALVELVQSSNGDVRCCLNTLQFLYRHASRAGGKAEALQMMRDMQGKDSKLGLWDMWRLMFERQERNSYVHLLHKEFAIDYGATLMAGIHHGTAAAHTMEMSGGTLRLAEAEHVAQGFRVDPGHVYVSRVVQQCPDTHTLLDGLQEFYLQRFYADYSFSRTRSMADAFCFQDKLTTCAYRDASATTLIPFVEQYACTTAATCFSCCSSSRRSGAGLGFPRESAGLSRRLAESANIVRTFRDGCHGETAAHMSSVNVVAQETAPLLLHSLLDASLRVSAHSIASVSALSPRDQQLLLAAVARHAEYGLSYARAAKAGNGGGDADDTVEEHWELTPPIHRLAGLDPRAASVPPSTRQATLATPSRMDASASPRPATAVVVLRQPEELRQLMVGEIRRFVIQRSAHRPSRGTTHASHSPTAVGEGVKGTDKKLHGVRAVEVERTTTAAAAAPQAPLTAAAPSTAPAARPRPSGKRDFFGRLIPEDTAKTSSSATYRKPAGVVTAAKLTVQYIYHDGSTNAVRIPAAFSDF
ncbi:hypothetical protein TraAM80_01680 [Trypanosoma rangeli]|uniref:AAA+ ATPase domain-containing protein n=1 Tax=Trypanosoma rangeli TaxID=5698 RepID=A0A3S5IS83_TRYRA|nr:uncharacterized protein TraAM80_01680 [Trypanosoma rangeli]RNF10241.1 hypothetical protein TraAM80_01680 [Trypanosoma rangeli]|eukprot:RNF10241.1 hypothetical protein TraAM80_01680 [Trypanosoma rangeli]